MTRTVPPVIPHRSEGLGQAVALPGATARDMVELPLASMRRHRPNPARYLLRPVDTHGQIMDRGLVVSRGWEPGDRLGWRISGGIAVLSPSANGSATVTRKGHLRLPAELRHLVGAEIGTRVLMVAPTAMPSLLLVPMYVLDDMVARSVLEVLGGDLS